MAKKLIRPGIDTYYDTLQQIFNLEAGILSAVVPHYGEIVISSTL
jgi:hypothetical protein